LISTAFDNQVSGIMLR